LLYRGAPFAVVSTGTWVVTFAVGGDFGRLDPLRDTLANVDAYGRAVPSSRFMGGREFEVLTTELGEFSSEAVFHAMPSAIEKRVLLLPNVVEGSGPFPGRHRRWANALGASTQERWAAACLYLAFMTETCLDLITASGPVLVQGPFSENEVYVRSLASASGRAVAAVVGSTDTALGAALLANPVKQKPKEVVVEPLAWDISAYRSAWKAAASQ
jgi:sugar (pentulose or hexulose) kinase